MKIMELYLKEYEPTKEMYYPLIESFKYAFAFRSEYGDPKFFKGNLSYDTTNPQFIKSIYDEIMSRKLTKDSGKYYNKYKPKYDTGTANIVIKTPNEVIVITSSINLRFGSGVVSRYGFIYNNQLSDFSLPTRTDAGHLKYSKNNFPAPLKTPLSSMACSILAEKGKKSDTYYTRYALGAAGGPKIITSIAQVLTNIFAKNINIHDAIRIPRCHHQLIPEYLTMQKDFEANFKTFIQNHNYTTDPVFMRDDYSAVTGIQVHPKGYLSASFDPRRSGGVEIW